MGINDSIYYYDFAKIYRNFNRVCKEGLVNTYSFERLNKDNIVKLLLCIVEHYDFGRFLRKYNMYRLRDQITGKHRRVDYILDMGLVSCVGEYYETVNYDSKKKLDYTCFLLDGVLNNMRNWKQ